MKATFKLLSNFFLEIPKDEEFLEAVISAMRSLLQMIASKNIPQVQNISQLQPFRFAFLTLSFMDNFKGVLQPFLYYNLWMQKGLNLCIRF